MCRTFPNTKPERTPGAWQECGGRYRWSSIGLAKREVVILLSAVFIQRSMKTTSWDHSQKIHLSPLAFRQSWNSFQFLSSASGSGSWSHTLSHHQWNGGDIGLPLGLSQANWPYLCSWALNAWERKKKWYGFLIIENYDLKDNMCVKCVPTRRVPIHRNSVYFWGNTWLGLT